MQIYENLIGSIIVTQNIAIINAISNTPVAEVVVEELVASQTKGVEEAERIQAQGATVASCVEEVAVVELSRGKLHWAASSVQESSWEAAEELAHRQTVDEDDLRAREDSGRPGDVQPRNRVVRPSNPS